jgi:two-component system invasion response regulator UvrY
MRPAPQRVRIAIADDHPIVRRGLCHLVEQDCEVVAEAGSGDEMIAIAADCPCDVFVLDLAMPGPGGLAVLKELRRLRPDVPVLVLSVSPEDQFALRAIKAGASGYLTKRSAPEDLINAIRHIAQGRLHVSAAIGRRLTEDILRPPLRTGPASARLSDREFEVLSMFAAGESLTAIGARLSLSVKTISTYRRRLMIKLALPNNAALIRYAIDNHIIES